MTDKEELTRGDALARVAVLEAEVAELRKRVCVPEGCRQRLASEGKPFPKSGCAVCGAFSPRWKECDAMLAAAPAYSGQTEALYITHRPLINNAINLLGMRRPVAQDVELVINGLRAMLDGMPTPAEPAAEHWISAAHSAAPAPVERVEQAGRQGEPVAVWDDLTKLARATSNRPIPHGAPLYTAPQPAPTVAQDVAGPTMLELLEKIDAVRMGDEESAYHVHCAAYWNNAVVACLDAVRKAHQSGGAK
jgi:hypothetical protein